MNCAKTTFTSEEKQTKNRHRKYYTGTFDVSDINEMSYLIITEVFYATPDEEKCVSVNGIRSVVPITDGKTLIQNISFFFG